MHVLLVYLAYQQNMKEETSAKVVLSTNCFAINWANVFHLHDGHTLWSMDFFLGQALLHCRHTHRAD